MSIEEMNEIIKDHEKRIAKLESIIKSLHESGYLYEGKIGEWKIL